MACHLYFEFICIMFSRIFISVQGLAWSERECLTLSPWSLVLIDVTSSYHPRGGERERERERETERQSEGGGGFTLAPHFCPINRLPVCCVFCMTKEGNIKLPFVMKMHFAN